MTEDQRKSSLFRAVNDRIREIGAEWDASHPVSFVCECDRADCNEVLNLTVAEYEAIRARHDCFVVVRGHDSHPGQYVVAPSNAPAVIGFSAQTSLPAT